MVIDSTGLKLFTATLQKAWSGTYEHDTLLWNKLASRWNSKGETDHIPLSSVDARMRKWTDNRKIRNVKTTAQSVTNELYEWTLEVERTKLEDDLYQQYIKETKTGAKAARMWADDLIVEAIEQGHTMLCFDGLSFFNAAHRIDPWDEDSGTYSNLVTGSALNPTNFEARYNQFCQAQDWSGRRMRRHKPTLLVVPTSLQVMGKKICEHEKLQDTTNGGEYPNPFHGLCELLVLDDLTSQTDWYFFRTDAETEMYPLIYVDRIRPQFQTAVNPDDPTIIMTDKFIYGSRARGTYAYGLPFDAMKCSA